MTSRERVLKALNFQVPDRLPKDLGGMASTGISAFAYPKLVEALGLPPRLPRVFDTWQMLAFPDEDVLDALGCDVVSIFEDVTNAFDQPEKWEKYDFNGRLFALVRDRSIFENREDGTVIQPASKLKMVPNSYVFDEEHGGQPLDLSSQLKKDDLGQVEKQLKDFQLSDDDIEQIRQLCQKARQSSDRAILYTGPLNTGLNISRGGIATFSMLCITEPDYIRQLHELITEYSIKMVRRLLPHIHPYIDIIMLSADDWGSQNSLIASPKVYEELFLPFTKQVNDECHSIAPDVKTFMHCCGAVYDILDLIIEGGFDVLNPVQWSAGVCSCRRWKDKCQGRIALWGGGINSQVTLPMGTMEQVEKETTDAVACLSENGGYVFNSIHNILAEIDPTRVIAMYKAASKTTW